jgi:hypothetical protein
MGRAAPGVAEVRRPGARMQLRVRAQELRPARTGGAVQTCGGSAVTPQRGNHMAQCTVGGVEKTTRCRPAGELSQPDPRRQCGHCSTGSRGEICSAPRSPLVQRPAAASSGRQLVDTTPQVSKLATPTVLDTWLID